MAALDPRWSAADNRPMSRASVAILLFAALCVLPVATRAETGLPVPRFVSLAADEVNVRTGPGTKYPIQWVFRRKGLPVEIIQEFEHWRRVRDWEGGVGWVHQSTLSGRRTALVTGALRTLRDEPDMGAPAVAHVEPGVVGRLLECRDDWCHAELEGYRGWLFRDHFWGAYPNEPIE